MTTFSKKRVQAFDDYDELRLELLSKEELHEQDKQIEKEVLYLKKIQESVSKEVAKFMTKEDIGINELTRRLGTSSRQTNRIMGGQANITIATLVELAVLMKKRPKIIFE